MRLDALLLIRMLDGPDITDQIGDQVEFRFADGSAPTVVQDAADASALFVLMPMRV